MTALLDTYAQFPFEVVEAHGARLKARDGRTLWDLYGGHAVCLLGHSHPAVARAVGAQASKLAFYSNVVPLEIRTRAAERLCRFAEAGLERVFFCNSGAEANENALKLALKQTGRTKIAALSGGWHGRTLLALSATDDAKLTPGLEGVLCRCVRLRPNEEQELAGVDETVAAVIVEPILSIAGIVELTHGYLAALRRRCDEVGAMLIFDEVQTGMGRTGRPFVAGWGGEAGRLEADTTRPEKGRGFDGPRAKQELHPIEAQWESFPTAAAGEGTRCARGERKGATALSMQEVLPDMVTSAKGIANGVPMGAVLMNERVAERVRLNDLGSTFGGGPLACAAMLAVIETIEREALLGHAAAVERRMRETLCVGPVESVVGRGCLIGLRVSGAAKVVQKQLMECGFVTGTSADERVLRLMPPINLPLEAVDEMREALKKCTAE